MRCYFQRHSFTLMLTVLVLHIRMLWKGIAGLLKLPTDKVDLEICSGSSSPCPPGLDYGKLVPLPGILMFSLTSAPELPLQTFLKPCLACQVPYTGFLHNLSKCFPQIPILTWLVLYKSFLRI